LELLNSPLSPLFTSPQTSSPNKASVQDESQVEKEESTTPQAQEKKDESSLQINDSSSLNCTIRTRDSQARQKNQNYLE
ncbi:hypothetical protein PoMZ_08384, partial [Pyricularia oryzae]